MIKKTTRNCLLFSLTAGMLASAANAATLSLDFQPTGGTTAAGYQAFTATNQDSSAGASASYSAFGSTIMVTLSTSNLPDGALDFRAVTRNGGDSATNIANDWIGTDLRNTGTDVTMTINISGLPAGSYNWLSGHHDGGGASGTGNGNLQGLADYSFTDSTGTAVVPNGIDLTRNDLGETPAFFSNDFVSDGTNDIVVSIIMDNGQGDVGDANSIFIHMNSLAISEIPEPSVSLLAGLGLLGLMRRRR